MQLYKMAGWKQKQTYTFYDWFQNKNMMLVIWIYKLGLDFVFYVNILINDTFGTDWRSMMVLSLSHG